MVFFSIIIPIYNAELYLERCLKSIVRQSLQNYEVILVDDDSQDHSSEICEELCRCYDNLIYEHVPHGGASAARNYGIKKAKGQYLAFVDADDYIQEDMLLKLYEVIFKGDVPDICYMNCHYTIVEKNQVIHTVFKWEDIFEEVSCLSANDFLRVVTKKDNYIPGSSWLMICNTKFIREHHILFNESVAWSEDADFSYQVLQVAEKVKCCNFCGYYYNMDNTQSISKGITLDKAIGRMSIYYKWAVYFIKDKKAEERFSIEVRERVVQQLLSEYCHILNLYWEMPNIEEQSQIKKKLQNERSVWKRCTDRRFRDYVRYGVTVGTMIQRVKRKIKKYLKN